MVKEINEKINKLKEEIALKAVLEKKLKALEIQLENDLNELKNLEINLKKEHKDVEKLEKLSFANILATLMKNKEEKLEKEQQEYLISKIKYEEFSTRVALLKENVENLKVRLTSLRYCENEYNVLLKKKLELIKLYGDSDKKDKIIALEKEIDKSLREKKEVEEAETAGKELLRAAVSAKDSLESAKNWGIFDIAGGDMLSSIAKHNKINEAEAQFRRVSSLISRFNKELGDIQLDGLIFTNTTIAFDIFFDNIFTDFSVQNKINSSLESVRGLIRTVEDILSDLKRKKDVINTRIYDIRKDYDSTIESI